MSGRYASTKSRTDLMREFDISESYADEGQPPDYNMVPTKKAPVVLTSTPRGDDEPERQLRNLRWGLVPFWAKDLKIGSKMINARAETVHEKRSYAKPFAERRLIVPVAGFFEWLPTEQLGKTGKPLKQPFYIHPKDGDSSLALAGIYSWWKDSSKDEDDPDRWVGTYSIITTTATDDVGRVHDRMPMAVTQDRWPDWLEPRADRSQRGASADGAARAGQPRDIPGVQGRQQRAQ